MRRRRTLPPPALLEMDEQTFWERYRPVVDPVEGQAIRGPGSHAVNRLGYVVTERPWPHNSVVAVYSNGVSTRQRQDEQPAM